MSRQPKTISEHARALQYGIKQARKALDKLTPETLESKRWTVHAILANLDTTYIEEQDPIKRRELYARDIDVSGWCLDWWPEYPDWVFDDYYEEST